MNDVPTQFRDVADRLRRAIVAEGNAIEKDVATELNRVGPISLHTRRDSGPSVLVDISPLPTPTTLPSRRRIVLAVAAVALVALAVIVAVQRRDAGTDIADEGAPRFFLPQSVPDGYVASEARQGIGDAAFSPDLWTRLFVERQSGEIRRALFITTAQGRPGDRTAFIIIPTTSTQRVSINGRAADISTSGDRISLAFEDFGCGSVTVNAVGYDTRTLPPPDLIAHLAAIVCGPTASDRTAASIPLPTGFELERDYDASESMRQQWRVSYVRDADQLAALSPLQLTFVASNLPPDLVDCGCEKVTVVERGGRTYRTNTIDTSSLAPTVSLPPNAGPIRSAITLATVSWHDRGYLLVLSSSTLSVDELLVVADSVREVSQAEFDQATHPADGAPSTAPATR